MRYTPTTIPEVIVIEPQVHGDDRGYFQESFRQDLFLTNIKNINFIQDNESKSSKGVLRGLHYQLPPKAQSKLVRVIQGEVLDIAVDIRKGSPTFMQHVSVILNEENKKQFFIPRGFAHGFIVLSETAIFQYKVDNYYSPEHDRGIQFNDPALGIDWQLSSDQINLSGKDLNQPPASKAELFNFDEDLYDL